MAEKPSEESAGLESKIDSEIEKLESELETEPTDEGEETAEEDSTSEETEEEELEGEEQPDAAAEKSAEKPEETSEEEEEIPKEEAAAFKKANYWRKEARNANKKIDELSANIPKMVEEALKKQAPANQDETYVQAKNEVLKIVDEYLNSKQQQTLTQQQKYDAMVQEMIAECEEEFGDDFDEQKTLKFANEMGLPNLRVAHLWLKDREKTSEKTTKIMQKKAKANLAGAGSGREEAHNYGISKEDNLNTKVEKIVQNWKT
jgi:hypothetical protein